ncbi:hypothetical protein PPYR_01676 [Photinus pyralis]|uniref:Major facilitator superfamily (MFS) profile domain-containing protein n=1 Tax=Photinus pyralis TaxID=7054 RepID=A0A5N4B571_PHOPY|nr:proton-coupled folate transporter-like [Photinus pyralis]KAB0804706.1 hypothetical protein PPYR_01676 [Photinus pyralis]
MFNWFKHAKIRVEIPYLLFGFSFMMESSITTNFLLYRTCYATLGYSENECQLLGTDEYANNNTTDLETEVQAYATRIIVTRSVIEACMSSIFCFFLASWSDKHGRRPLLLLGITGLLLSYLIMAIVSSLSYISPWYFLLHEIPLCLCGSNISLMTACLSYISDTVPEGSRGLRLGLMEGAVNIGMFIGTSSCSYIFNSFGYQTVYLICVTCQLCSWIFSWFCIEESVEILDNEKKWYALFDVAPVKESMVVLFKRRANNDRTTLWCLFGIFAIFTGGRFADTNVIFLYLRKNFSWTLERYTLFLAFSTVTWITFCFAFIVILVKTIRVKEIVAIMFALIFSISSSLMQGFASKNWHIYGAATLRSMGSCVSPLTQSLMSKVAPKEESARLFAALVSFSTVSLLLSIALNTYVYNQTILFLPQAFTFVTTAIYILTMVVAIIASFVYRERRPDYNLLVNEDDGNTKD